MFLFIVVQTILVFVTSPIVKNRRSVSVRHTSIAVRVAVTPTDRLVHHGAVPVGVFLFTGTRHVSGSTGPFGKQTKVSVCAGLTLNTAATFLLRHALAATIFGAIPGTRLTVTKTVAGMTSHNVGVLFTREARVTVRLLKAGQCGRVFTFTRKARSGLLARTLVGNQHTGLLGSTAVVIGVAIGAANRRIGS